jgi:hypothetical protein
MTTSKLTTLPAPLSRNFEPLNSPFATSPELNTFARLFFYFLISQATALEMILVASSPELNTLARLFFTF